MQTHTNDGFRRPIRYLALVILLVLGLAACSAPGLPAAAQPPTTTPIAAPVATASPAPTTAGTIRAASDFSGAIREVAQRVKPAVVQITNEQVQFNSFTNQPFTVPAGVGSGVIYDDQGHILTNNHVVAGAQQLTVALPAGSTYPANLIGADPYTDLAVLQIDGKNLPSARFGNSQQLQVGDWVVAIGNALALSGGPTVSAGVVSALGRTVQEPSDTGGAGPYLFDVIQTDAPINPGNSGGPLIDLRAEVMASTRWWPGRPSQGCRSRASASLS